MFFEICRRGIVLEDILIGAIAIIAPQIDFLFFILRPNDVTNDESSASPGLLKFFLQVITYGCLLLPIRPQFVRGRIADGGINGIWLKNGIHYISLMEMSICSPKFAPSMPLFTLSHKFSREFNANEIRIGKVMSDGNKQGSIRTPFVHNFFLHYNFFDIVILYFKDGRITHGHTIRAIISSVRETAFIIQ